MLVRGDHRIGQRLPDLYFVRPQSKQAGSVSVDLASVDGRVAEVSVWDRPEPRGAGVVQTVSAAVRAL